MSEFIYKKIKKHILSLIDEGLGVSDYPLPSENQLALKFKASRISVRSALSELEKEGKVVRLKGRGTFPKKAEPADGKLYAVILPSPSSVLVAEIIRGITDYCNTANAKYLMFFSLNSADLEARHIETALELNSTPDPEARLVELITKIAYDFKEIAQ